MTESKYIYFEISIHALRKEGDAGRVLYVTNEVKFLSTPSARRATRDVHGQGHLLGYFYPRPPQGGRRLTGKDVQI